MKLIVNYKGINKTMLNAESFDDIVKFVHENFFLKMSKWTMSYIDSDGDSISLDSQIDVQTMFESCEKDNIKIYVKDVEFVQQQDLKFVGQQINIKEINQTSNVKVQKVQKEEQKQPENIQKNAEATQEKGSNKMVENQFQRCGGWEIWKKKMEQKMAKFVDERVELLLPYITKKVEEKMLNKEQKSVKIEQKRQKINHQVKCNVCGLKEIIGIRYKCVKCPSFNLCQQCEQNQGHNHNMIKMKFLQEEQEHKSQNPFKPWWKRPNDQGLPFPPPPQFGMPGNFGPMHFGPMPGMHPPPPPPFSFMPNMNRNEQRKQKNCDERLKITKKCFRMSECFGGEPKQYEEFVTKNLDLKFDELTKLYKVMNESVNIQQIPKQKIQKKTQQLSFYFKEPTSNFAKFVQDHQTLNLKELIKSIKENKKNEPVQLLKVENQIKVQKNVEMQEPKKELIEVKAPEKKQISVPAVTTLPAVPVPPAISAPIKKPLDIQRRNECILEMKELFGHDNVYDYISFYNQHQQEEKHIIIEKYIEKLTKEK